MFNKVNSKINEFYRKFYLWLNKYPTFGFTMAPGKVNLSVLLLTFSKINLVNISETCCKGIINKSVYRTIADVSYSILTEYLIIVELCCTFFAAKLTIRTAT